MTKQTFFAPFKLDWKDFLRYRLRLDFPKPYESFFESEYHEMALDIHTFRLVGGGSFLYYHFVFSLEELTLHETYELCNGKIHSKTIFSSKEQLEKFVSTMYKLFGIVHHYKHPKTIDYIPFLHLMRDNFDMFYYDTYSFHYHAHVCGIKTKREDGYEFYAFEEPKIYFLYLKETRDCYFFSSFERNSYSTTLEKISYLISQNKSNNQSFIHEFMDTFKKRRLKLTF